MGSFGEGGGVHLFKWEVVSKLMEDGGLSHRNLTLHIETLLAFSCVSSRTNTLWSRILVSMDLTCLKGVQV